MSEPNPVKTYLASLLRHATTALLGLGGLLASHDLIDPADAASVDAAGGSLQAALIVIVVAVVGRLAITLTGKIFPATAAKLTGPGAGGPLPVWVGIGAMAGLLMAGLPSCSPAQLDSLRAVPIRFTLITPEGDIGYSSKGGLSVDYRSGK